MERRAELDAVVERYRREPTALLQILRDAQDLEGWLPPATLTYLAQLLALPRARVEGVAGFYSFLRKTLRMGDRGSPRDEDGEGRTGGGA